MIMNYFFPDFLKKFPPNNPASNVGINKVGKPVDGIDAGGVEVEYKWLVGLILILEVVFGVGVTLTVVTAELLFLPIFFKSILLVTTAKKTITTTNPKIKETILFKPSIC